MSAEIIERLDKLALDLTMAENLLVDLQTTVELGQHLENLKTDIAEISPPAGVFFSSISLIFDKFILGDAGSDLAPGAIELVNDTLSLVRDAISGASTPEEFDARAKSLAAIYKENFDINIEAGTLSPQASSREQTPQETPNEGMEKGSPVLDVLDKLALEITMSETPFTDMHKNIELAGQIDSLKEMLLQERPELAGFLSSISSLFELYLLDKAEKGKETEAITITGDTISLVRDAFSGVAGTDETKARGETLTASLKNDFAISVAEAPAPSPATPKPAEAKAPEKKEAPMKEEKDDKKPEIAKITLLDENDAVIYEGFLDESTDQVNKIEEFIMTLEENPNDMEIINSMFRVFHSLKGAAGFLGLSEINFLCHEAENLLDKARKGQMEVDSEFIDIVLAARDVLEKGLTSLDDLIREGRKNLPNFTGYPEKLHIEPILTMIDTKLYGDEEPPKLGEILVKKKQVEPEKLEEALTKKQKPLGEMLVEMGATKKEDVESALKEQEEKQKKAVVSAAIKVDTKKLNLLLELVGELVISQAIISQNKVLTRDENIPLSKDITEMAKITAGIQDHIMSLRMVPLKQLFQKMHRLVRDLARKTNKRVNLEIHGEETEIDKTIVEQLNDPLVHLLRNSVDHGVEDPDSRINAGKSMEGTITLSAYQQGGNVVIEIKDDGKGIDTEKVREKALERGLIEPGKTYTDTEIINFIFLPGFSTHKVATDISGRGVGMDVVRKNVEGLGGRVEIESRRNKGSTFYIKLPLTMAIVDGMLVRVGEERYIIPIVTISESVRPRKEQINSVIEQGEVINVRGELIPLIRLHDLFGINNSKTDPSEGLVIIVQNEKEKRGLLVDDLLGQQQVVIKTLDRRLQGIKGFSGSSILGDGLVGLIIDIGGLIEIATA